MAEDALVESLLPELLWRFRVGDPWKLLATSLCRWALEWSPIASIQLAARAVRRAGAKNIEGGDVTRSDVSSG